MAHVLVNDVLREIFLHLVNPNPFTGIYTIDDLHNLYQCILVNRTWCSIAIPILWSQPFHFLKENPDSGTANEHKMSSMEICEYRRPPMFNYPGFMRSMWYETMVQAIEAWCLELSEIMNPDNENTAMNEQEDKLIDNAEIVVMKSVLKLCLNKGARLNCLFLHPDRLDELNDELYEMLLVNEEFKDLVSSIKTLEINGMIRKNNVYLMLSKRCRKLECLYIHSLWARNHDKKYVDNFGNAITTLITSQHSLRYFTLSNCKAYARAIVPPLKHQSSSLRYIRFENVDFRGCDPWESVAECKRIELLEVYECSNLNEEMVAPVINARFGKEFEARYVSSNQCQKFEDWVDKQNYNR
ncbi:7168_t:CDS:2 [Diversispora eburnea]|uniref:7168_t:CDS:1 n=2 Tax=Diversisporales TaxID=214509 RepID=A0A9N9BAP2_9GLOM|nr:7168_t:CDS:2 [Diversispora eburnea]